MRYPLLTLLYGGSGGVAPSGSAPTAPLALQTYAMDGSVALQWQAPQVFGGVYPATYNVYRGGSKIASGLYTPYYLDTSVSNGSTYSYTITAVAAGGGESPQCASSGATPTATVTLVSDSWAGGGAGPAGIDSTKWNTGSNNAGYSITGGQLTLQGNSTWTGTMLVGKAAQTRAAGTAAVCFEIPINVNTVGYCAFGWSDSATPAGIANLWHAFYIEGNGEVVCRDNLSNSDYGGNDPESQQENGPAPVIAGDTLTLRIWMLPGGGAYWRLQNSSEWPGCPRPLMRGYGANIASMFPCILAYSGSFTVGPVKVLQTAPPPLAEINYNGCTSPDSSNYGIGMAWEEMANDGKLGYDIFSPILGAATAANTASAFSWDAVMNKDPCGLYDPATGNHWMLYMGNGGLGLGLAASRDGMRYTRWHGNPFLSTSSLPAWGAGQCNFPAVWFDWRDPVNPVKLWWCAADSTGHGTAGYIKGGSFPALASAVAAAVNTLNGGPVLGQAQAFNADSGNVGPFSAPCEDPVAGKFYSWTATADERGVVSNSASGLEGPWTTGSTVYTARKLRYQVTNALTAGTTNSLSITLANATGDVSTGNPITDGLAASSPNGDPWILVDESGSPAQVELVFVTAAAAVDASHGTLTLMRPVLHTFPGTTTYLMPLDYWITPTSADLESPTSITMLLTGWHQRGATTAGDSKVESQFSASASSPGGTLTFQGTALPLPAMGTQLEDGSPAFRDSSENPRRKRRLDSNHRFWRFAVNGALGLGGTLPKALDNTTFFYDLESSSWTDATGVTGALVAHGTVTAVAGLVGNGAQGTSGGYLLSPNVVIGTANTDGCLRFFYKCAQTASAEVLVSILNGTTGLYLTQNGGTCTLTVNNGVDGPVTLAALNSMAVGSWYYCEINWNTALQQIGLLVKATAAGSIGTGQYNWLTMPTHGFPSVTGPLSVLAKGDGSSPATGIVDSLGGWLTRDAYFPETVGIYNAGAGRNYASMGNI